MSSQYIHIHEHKDAGREKYRAAAPVRSAFLQLPYCITGKIYAVDGLKTETKLGV